ncbi:PREDICTED: taste receptor type 2 member 7-like [Bison bison bison]|uniref:Taste receptor type 2 n=1 Tax=Bison bison bison TaxID=43346 RepID=A0A6P3J191_BISBB|nr:PREDICTED: taste receptor type 2 member 7-like [Bison bison bison]
MDQSFLFAVMLNILEKIFMVVTGGEFIIGILGNGFIGLTACIAWIRNQKLSLLDLILTSLAFARISQLWITTVMFFSMMFYQAGFGTVGRKYIFFCIWILTSHSSTWLATCLAVFYFLKIASFSHPPFLWLKWRINKVVSMLPLVSVPFLVIIPPPFFLSLISFLLLLHSLWKHKKNIAHTVRDSRNPCVEVHFRAMKTVFFFLMLFVLYQFGLFMTFGGHFFLQNKLVVMFGYMLGMLYPSSHSYVLIFGNSQMRKFFLVILRHLKCGL